MLFGERSETLPLRHRDSAHDFRPWSMRAAIRRVAARRGKKLDESPCPTASPPIHSSCASIMRRIPPRWKSGRSIDRCRIRSRPLGLRPRHRRVGRGLPRSVRLLRPRRAASCRGTRIRRSLLTIVFSSGAACRGLVALHEIPGRPGPAARIGPGTVGASRVARTSSRARIPQGW